jgi:ParB family chromosome partitioning protein
MTTNKEVRSKKGGLGKGLNSLLGLSDLPSEEVVQKKSTLGINQSIIKTINPWEIEPNPQQPRKIFDSEKLRDLSESIKVNGLLQPLLVSKPAESEKYILIAGERRWRASKMAGLSTVPVVVKEVASDDMLRLALIENIQRHDLNIIEEAEAYASLINDYGLTQEECAKRVGKDRTTVTNALRILTLPKEILDDLLEDRLSMGHSRCLLALPDKKTILKARDIIIKKNLSVRQAEQLVKRIKSQGFATKKDKEAFNPDLEYWAESLRSKLKTKVRLAGSGSRGKIEISYFSGSELERIVNLLSH